MNDYERNLLEAFWKLKRLKPAEVLPGVNFFEFFVLFAVKSGRNRMKRPMKISEIAQALDVVPPAVSRTMKCLEQKQLIVREVDKEDRRNTYVMITKQGDEIVNQSEQIVKEILAAVYERMGGEKMQQFIEGLNAFGTDLKIEMDKRKEQKSDGKDI